VKTIRALLENQTTPQQGHGQHTRGNTDGGRRVLELEARKVFRAFLQHHVSGQQSFI